MPIPTFLSRPTRVRSEYQIGLDNFLHLIESKDLLPRTLGSTDYPTDSPLDEVIRIVRQCKGAIVLGYPQIHIQNGILIDKILPSEEWNDVDLSTEWNHIEAALVHAFHRPLLCIHHLTVRRGVFDRGAMPKYLYMIDLTNPNWYKMPEIMGALDTFINQMNQIPVYWGLEEKEIDQKYVKAIGIEAEMAKDGYRLFWTTPNELDLCTDFLGYERIVWKDNGGKTWLLAGKRGDLVPLKTKKTPDEINSIRKQLL